jgi:phospholipase C
MSKKKILDVSRRDVIRGVGALGGVAVVGCGNASSQGDGPGGSATKADELEGGSSSGGDDAHIIECMGTSNLTDDQLLAPIENIVVLMMENRSFDHYFGGGLGIEEGRDDVNGLLGGETNPGPNGELVEAFRQFNPFLAPPPHTWDAMHAMWNGGKNDGFCLEHHKVNGEMDPMAFKQVMGYQTREDLPIHYALADAYSLCDAYHCSLLGPTWPNRFYLHAASSGGRKNNTPRPFLTTIWDLLDDADLRGVNYFSDVPWASAALFKVFGFSKFSTFLSDALRGRLPPFSIIDPGFFTSSEHPGFGGDSEHPEMGPNLPLGQLFISTVYNALAASPQWKKTLFVITYDENGGLYDHVQPPEVTDERSDFRRLGFRVPTLLIGPHVRKGCINNTLLEHSSVIATATKRFGLEMLNDRVAQANTFASAINPEYINDPQAPIRLPEIEIDEAMLMDHLVPDPSAAPELWQAAENKDIPPELDRRYAYKEDLKTILTAARDFGIVHDRIRWGRPTRD